MTQPTTLATAGPFVPPSGATRRPVRFATARNAGLLYVVIIVGGLFAELAVRSRLVEYGDPAETARRIVDSPGLFRLAMASDLLMFVADVAIAVALYVLLRPISRTWSAVAAAFRLTQTAIIGFNLLAMFQALRILDDVEYLDSFTAGQTEALAMLSLEAHRYGYVLGLVFFGVGTIVTAYLVRLSPSMPSSMALLLALAGFGYVVDAVMFFMIPGYDGSLSVVVLAPALVGEIWFAGWLLTRGRRLDGPQAGRDVATTVQQQGTTS